MRAFKNVALCAILGVTPVSVLVGACGSSEVSGYGDGVGAGGQRPPPDEGTGPGGGTGIGTGGSGLPAVGAVRVVVGSGGEIGPRGVPTMRIPDPGGSRIAGSGAVGQPDPLNTRRQNLITYLWGRDGFPSDKLPSSVDRDVTSPVSGLSNLERVDTLHLQMAAGIESLAHHFIPSAAKKNRLVILHHGHAITFDDDPDLSDVGYGMQRTIDSLLIEGYSVLAVYMPGCLPTAPAVDHASIVNTKTTGSGLKFFLEPVAAYLNYLGTQSDADEFPAYTDFSMVGLSGGGWTTTVYAAIDPRITLSIPVAGSIPLSLRSGYSWGDEEQTHAAFYQIAGYTDLYVLGSTGTGRRQVQVLNRYDDCCFGENPAEYDPDETGMSWDDALRSYERDVRNQLAAINNGSFRLEIDEVAPSHTISWNTIATIIMPELARGAVPASAPAPEPFVRGGNGTLVYRGQDGAVDTKIPVVGIPAFLNRDEDTFDVFFRDPKSRLMHAFNASGTWTAKSLGTVVATDPVAVWSGPGQFSVVALTPDYLPHIWKGDGSNVTSDEAVSGAPRTLGQPVLSVLPDNRLDLLMWGWDHAPYNLCDEGDGVWGPE